MDADYEAVAAKCKSLADLSDAASKSPMFKSITLDSLENVKTLVMC